MMQNARDMDTHDYSPTHWVFLSGSRAEGLAMRVGWGHEEPDFDVMFTWQRLLGVPVEIRPQTLTAGPLSYPLLIGGIISLETGESPPGYARLRVCGDYASVEGYMASNRYYIPDTRGENSLCTVQKDGRLWVLPSKVIKLLTWDASSHPFNNTASPAVLLKGAISEIVPSLICPQVLPFVDDFLSRNRCVDWPPKSVLFEISQLPTLVVAAGHKSSANRDIEWRISTTHYELVISNAMPVWVKQAYWAFKYITKKIKRDINGSPPQGAQLHSPGRYGGRHKLSSFHLKTTFLWELETSEVWFYESSHALLLRTFRSFIKFITEGRIPHYFMPHCNLLECVDPTELKATVLYIRERVLCDAYVVGAIITSPMYPRQLYGCEESEEYVHENDIVLALSNIADAATRSDALCNAVASLREICTRLDKHRNARHNTMAETGKHTHDPPHKLVKLVEMLDSILHSCVPLKIQIWLYFLSISSQIIKIITALPSIFTMHFITVLCKCCLRPRILRSKYDDDDDDDDD